MSVSDVVVVAEWLRRWTRNPLGHSRVGSNPAADELSFYQFSFFYVFFPFPTTTEPIVTYSYTLQYTTLHVVIDMHVQ